MNEFPPLGALRLQAEPSALEVEKTPHPGAYASKILSSMQHAILWILEKTRKQRASKVLKVCESVSLGEKRFVAVVQVAHERFLIGGASGSVSMLARLDSADFASLLQSSQETSQ